MFRRYDLIINKTKKCRDYGIYISKRVDIPLSTMEYESVNVVGRDGTLTKEKGYLDREITVDFNFYDRRSIPKKMREINTLFSNVEDIFFTDDDEVYYKVKRVDLGDLQREIRHFGFFTVTFIVEPFSFHNRVMPIIITSSGYKLKNPCNHYSLPKLTIYGSGDITVTVNNITTKFNDIDGHITVDSELMETYKDEVLQNNKKVGEYFKFDIGTNIISYTGKVDKIIVEPLWRWR